MSNMHPANHAALRQALMACAHRRVDFITIGDSNQVKSGNGWNHGFQYALAQRFPMYATGLTPVRENNGNGWGSGYKYSIFPQSHGASSGAPADLDKFRGPGGGHDYRYLTDAESGSNTEGLIVGTDCPLDITGNLTWEFHYGTFTASDGAGSFQAGVRKNSGDCGWAGVAAGSQIDPVTGAYGLQRTTVATNVGNNTCPLMGGFGMSNTQAPEGPFIGYYIQAINDDRGAGFALHNTIYDGGASARQMAATLQGSNADWPGFYFGEIRRVQMQRQQRPLVVVVINSGLNDRNESGTSVGPNAIADGDSPEAFADNLQAIINWFESVWSDNGWQRSELVFWIVPSHRISDPDDAELASYRNAAARVAHANYQTAASFLDSKASASLMGNEDWYFSDSDQAHLSEPGYEQMALREIETVVSPHGTSRRRRAPHASKGAVIYG